MDEEQANSVRIGGLIFFLSEEEQEDGFLSGGLMDGCILKQKKDIECIFKILPMTQYSAKKALKDRNKRRKYASAIAGASGIQENNKQKSRTESMIMDVDNDPELEQLKEYQKLEEMSNTTITAQLEGKPLLFGQVIQLMHMSSGKLLSAKRKISEDDEETWSLKLNPDGSKKAYFKVVPHKFKSEGEKVEIGDQVRLIHVQSGLFIHQFSDAFIDEFYSTEVNLSKTPTAWTTKISDIPIDQKAPLLGGSAIRLFHTDCGYLKALTKSGDAVRVVCKLNPENKPSASYKNVWQIEDEAGGTQEILWNKPFRMKLLGSELYLALDTETEEKSHTSLTLTSNKSHNTLFVFVPVKRENDETINIDSPVHIQSYGTRQKWLHSAPDMIGPDLKANCWEVACTLKFSASDIFVIQAISQEQLERYLYVFKRGPVLTKYLESKEGSTDSIEVVLGELIRFVTFSEVSNPLQREGFPIKENQTLVLNQLLESLIHLLIDSFKNRNDRISKLIYRLIKQMAKSNPRAAVKINAYIDILAHPTEAVWVDAAAAIMEIYRDNKRLLETIDMKILEALPTFRKLMGNTKNPRFLELLSTLCAYKGNAVAINQKIICTLLEQNEELILHSRIGKSGVEVCVDDQWIPLEKLMYEAKKDLVEYYEQMLLLLSNVCMGRNYAGIKMVEKWISFKQAFLCLKDDIFEGTYAAKRIRMAYATLMQHAYLDCYPQKIFTRLKYTWPVQKTARLLGEQVNQPKGATMRPKPRLAATDIKSAPNLREFILLCVCNKNYFDWDPKQNSLTRGVQWKFFQKILGLLKVAYAFGFFKSDEEILIPRLKEILQLQMTISKESRFAKTLGRNALREEDTALLTQIKLEVCAILQLYLDLTQKFAFEEFISQVITKDDLPSKASETELRKYLLENLETIKDESFTGVEDRFELSPVLLNLMKEENNHLSAAALELLVRLQREKRTEMFSAISQVLFITDSKDIKNYEQIMQNIEELRKITASTMTSNDHERVVAILEEFSALCVDIDGVPKKINQHIFFSERVHEEVIGILKLPLEKGHTDYEGIGKIFNSCYNFLQKFCLGNLNNQRALHKYVGFMIDQRYHYPHLSGVSPTIIAIYQDNVSLCTKISHHEDVVRHFKRLANETDFTNLQFFKTLLSPGGHILKTNQSIVLKLMMGSRNPININLTTKIKDKEPTPEHRYLSQLVKLLAMCAAGKNQEAKNTCQKMLSVDECIQSLANAEYDPELESAYASFLDEVYLKSDSNSSNQSSMLFLLGNDTFWSILEEFTGKLGEIYTDHQRHKNSFFTPNEEEYMSTICSTLETFYSRHLLWDKITQKQINKSNETIDQVASLCEMYMNIKSRNETVLGHLYTCVNAMFEAGFTGGAYFEKVEPLLNEVHKQLKSLRENANKLQEDAHVEGLIERNLQTAIGKSYLNISELIDPHETAKPSYLELLVFQLRNTLYSDNKMKLTCLRVLSSMVAQKKNRDFLQHKLNQLEAPQAILYLLGSNDQAIVDSSLELLIALLDKDIDASKLRPNEAVQQSIMETFTSRPDETFFKNIHGLIEKTKNQIRQKKQTDNLRRNRGETNAIPLRAPSKTGKKKKKKSDINNIELTVLSTLIYEERNQYPSMFRVFRLLQLMCKSKSTLFKNYAREQADNPESYDVVKELVSFLKVFEGLIPTNMSLAIQLFATLTELVMDVPLNQMAVINAQIIHPSINKILHNPYNRSPASLELKIKILNFLLTLLQPVQSKIVSKMITTFEFDILEDFTAVLLTAAPSEQEVQLASLSYRLIKVLQASDATQNAKLAESVKRIEQDNCKQRIGRIEIVGEANRLETFYFPIPHYLRKTIPREWAGAGIHRDEEKKKEEQLKKDEEQLRKKSEAELQLRLQEALINWGTNWKKSTDKLEAFVRWADMYLLEAEYTQNFKKYRMSYWVTKRLDTWHTLSYLLALIINLFLIVLVDYRGASELGTVPNYIVLGLGLVQALVSLLLIFSFFRMRGPLIKYKGLRQYLPHNTTYIINSAEERTREVKRAIRMTYKDKKGYTKSLSLGLWRLYYVAILVKAYVTDFATLFYVFYFVSSVLGVVVSPYFYAYHLFLTIVRSSHLKTVVTAIRISTRTLLLMGLFIMQVIYVFSILSLEWFSQHYNPADGLPCESLIQCIGTNLYWGIPSGGGLFEFVQPYFWPEGGHTFAWIVYIVAFFIVFGVLLLNIFLAIIVDTFGQLRDARSDSEEAKASGCFICSIERDTFKRKGVDFLDHVENDHNIWHYLYFFAYMKDKASRGATELSEFVERDLYKKIKDGNILSFFPIERAKALETDEDREVNDLIYIKIKELEQLTQNALDQQEKIFKENKDVRSTLATLSEEVNSFRKYYNDTAK